MTQEEVQAIKQQQKRLAGDVLFTEIGPVRRAQGLEVTAQGLQHRVLMDLTVNTAECSVVVNVRVDERGAICRFCMNGLHRGRRSHHKHDLQSDACLRDNLPHAFDVTPPTLPNGDPDFESALEWFCQNCNIALEPQAQYAWKRTVRGLGRTR